MFLPSNLSASRCCLIVAVTLTCYPGHAWSFDGNSNGISDLFERTHSATGVLNPAADDDGDGYNNLSEYLLGGNPRRADQGIGGRAVLPGDGFGHLRFPTVEGLRYQVQFSLNLVDWDPVGGPFTGDGLEYDAPAPVPLTAGGQQFFRIVALPPLDGDGDGLNDWETSHLALGIGLIHRYSFNQAEGTTVPDLVSGWNATVKGAGATFNGTEILLPGGSSSTAAYLDLPNRILSRHAASTGGSGGITIDGWVTVSANQSGSQIFDFGSGSLGEIADPGGTASALDSFALSAQFPSIGGNQLSVRWINNDSYGGTGTAYTARFPSIAFGQQFHFALSFDDSSGMLRYYENGIQPTAAFPRPPAVVPSRLNNLNDVNNWLGRSNQTSSLNLNGRINEFRIFKRVLSPATIAQLSSASVGPTLDPAMDLDGDGLPAYYEIVAGLSDANPADALVDTDLDGLSLAEEYARGTNPNLADTDGDYFLDGFEVENGTNPLTFDDYSLDDSDGDRYPDIYETMNGSDPGSPASLPTPHFIVDASLVTETSTAKKTIQAAVNAAPNLTTDPSRWTLIEVLGGSYLEVVTIDQRRIFLLGRPKNGSLPLLTDDGTYASGDTHSLSLLEGGCAVDGLLIKRNSMISGNLAYGIRINADTPAGRVQLVNCVIRGTYPSNSVSDVGAIRAERGKLRVAHCTISENGTSGVVYGVPAGIRVEPACTLALDNSIIWNQAAPDSQITVLGSMTVRNSIIRGGGFAGSINTDPLFENRPYPFPDNGILLSAASPAINAGLALNVGKRDIHGGPRGSQPDIGADERSDGDSDGDGLADEWEYRAFASLAQSATGNGDGDALDNAGELAANTDPYDSDTDNDLMTDGYEVANGLAPLDAEDQLADNDGDRVPNIYEFNNGTLAGGANSTPAPHFIVDASLVTETSTAKKTIQAAVDAAPNLNTDPSRWTIIEVLGGSYLEVVTIDQRRIFLMGRPVSGVLPLLTDDGTYASGGTHSLSLLEGGCAVDGLLIKRNSASYGNAAYGIRVNADNPAGRVQLVNCVIRGTAPFNIASDVAALRAERGKLRVAHCTISENQGSGTVFSITSGIRVESACMLTLENSIIWNPDDQQITALGSITVANSIIRYGALSGAITPNPLFESRSYPSSDNGILLSAASPAIGKGRVLNVGKVDIHGESRGSRPDIGADERHPGNGDSDGDGMDDEWEYQLFDSLSEFEAGLSEAAKLALLALALERAPELWRTRPDTDGDGLMDLIELIAGGNTNLSDSNGDGIDDLQAYSSGISITGLDFDGDTLTFSQETFKGTNPYVADTDRDGVNDNLDFYPLDPTRTAAPTPTPGDTTPPQIFLDVPQNAIPLP